MLQFRRPRTLYSLTVTEDRWGTYAPELKDPTDLMGVVSEYADNDDAWNPLIMRMDFDPDTGLLEHASDVTEDAIREYNRTFGHQMDTPLFATEEDRDEWQAERDRDAADDAYHENYIRATLGHF